ncbi:MAG: hypothetical protein A2V86_13650 [Deltaproteobacteria bacterium RBG_16_49_23]|nr:MAG: hypothetical protein A2V86_13650 [Deltaproteobacteria bacterium RBG_16_49_23]
MDQSELVRLVIRALEATGIPYMITGSQASAYYGEPRFTRDIDIVADINPAQVETFITYFPSIEFYCDKEMIEAEIKRRGQFNILHSTSGLKIDIILLKTTPFSKTEFARRNRGALFPDQDTYFASPEDVIIKKMEFYKEGGSEKHLRDITGILEVSGEEIDRAYIDHWAGRLGLNEIWEAIQIKLNEKP